MGKQRACRSGRKDSTGDTLKREQQTDKMPSLESSSDRHIKKHPFGRSTNRLVFGVKDEA